MNTLSKLQAIFQDVFDDETIILTRETTARDIEEWDSLAQINIIVACEAEFKIKFNLNDIAALINVGGMVDLVEGKLI
jgi:acyl carrier protein